jgi:predicted dehydrogenase (TIGR03970 family)
MVRDGRVLPIGSASPLVQRYRTLLTDEPLRPFDIVRGATLGGSGAVNGGYFCHAQPTDFDPPIPGWMPDEVAQHYRAIESDLDFPQHGSSGPIHIRRVADFGEIAEAFIAQAQAAGFSWLPNLNAEHPGAGFGAVPLNIVDGIRGGPGKAYLEPALARPNLTVLTATRAMRLRLNGKRIMGVDGLGPGGSRIELRADRTVLAAGAIESARLLMLAGIGPEDMLAEAGIDTLVDLPVGVRFWDHPEWVMATDGHVATRRPVLEVLLLQDDVEIRPYSGGFIAMTGQSGKGTPDWPHLGVALMRPASRGRITLMSADPAVPPLIEHRYDSTPGDIVKLREGVELAREIVGGTTQLGKPRWSTSQHLCGTAPMGCDADENAVVDHRCAVRGVAGLWVADGSVLPWVTGVGPHATIVMLAHRASEFVG